MKNICIAYAFAMTLIYLLFAMIGWSLSPGEWTWEARTLSGMFILISWIAFWMKIEADRVVW